MGEILPAASVAVTATRAFARASDPGSLEIPVLEVKLLLQLDPEPVPVFAEERDLGRRAQGLVVGPARRRELQDGLVPAGKAAGNLGAQNLVEIGLHRDDVGEELLL